jgi:hypothetical protein
MTSVDAWLSLTILLVLEKKAKRLCSAAAAGTERFLLSMLNCFRRGYEPLETKANEPKGRGALQHSAFDPQIL